MDQGSSAPASDPAAERAAKRLAGMDANELRTVLDLTITAINRHAADFYRDWDAAHLEEIRMNIPVLGALLDEIEVQNEARIRETEKNSAGVVPQAFGVRNRI